MSVAAEEVGQVAGRGAAERHGLGRRLLDRGELGVPSQAPGPSRRHAHRHRALALAG